MSIVIDFIELNRTTEETMIVRGTADNIYVIMEQINISYHKKSVKNPYSHYLYYTDKNGLKMGMLWVKEDWYKYSFYFNHENSRTTIEYGVFFASPFKQDKDFYDEVMATEMPEDWKIETLKATFGELDYEK